MGNLQLVLPALNLSTLNAGLLQQVTSKIDDVLTEHGGLLHVLPLAVHLRFFGWTSRGGHSEPFLLFEVYEILVSAQGPLVFGFLGLGLRGLGPGLDNKKKF